MIKSLSSLFGFDAYVERMSLVSGPFRFSREIHRTGDREYWGLGLHLVISPLLKPSKV